METPITVDNNPAELPPSAQPQDLLGMEAQIKAASDAAQARGEDPSKLTVGVLANQLPVEVPQKFVAPTGEVDVEKLKTSTERLNEEIQKKEQVQKSVEDYLQAEKKFRNMPNTEKVQAATAPQPVAPPAVPPQLTRQQLEAQINADIQANPAATMANLIDIMFEQKFGEKIKPIAEGIQTVAQTRADEEKRSNLRALVEKDPRVLRADVFDAINAKIASDPDIASRKNPHKAAWLEVKEEMRLGEATQPPAPPRPLSPVLAGGTPPPLQSSGAGVVNVDSVSAAMAQANLKDPNQARNLEAAIKALADAEWRQVR